MNLRKTTLILLILAAAAVLWTAQRRQQAETRKALAAAASELQAHEERILETTEELERVQQVIAAEKPRLRKATLETVAAARACDEKYPDSRWAEPPAIWPEWNAESPYVWLRKEMLPRLPAPVFSPSGELHPAVAQVLTLSSAQQSGLNAALRDCLNRYHALETARVERVEEHLPGIAQQDGEKRTIRVTPLPEEGAVAKAEFETALHTVLGEQRALLVRQLADGWLDAQFSQSGAEPKTI